MAKERKKRKDRLTRKTADKYDLYLRSVQEPSVEVAFFNRVFKKQFGRRPTILREDFCGTAAVCCEWIRSRKDRIAVGVDLDPEPLQWSREHLIPKLKEHQRQRLTLLQEDVRQASPDKADVLAAQNFSFFLFRTREALREYFAYARANLADEGLMVLDMMGGSEVLLEEHEDKTKKDGFTYVWEQERFDPITHFTRFHIHFRFPDGSKMNKAFSYEWRLWMMPEVIELLNEAGFSQVDVYWEGVDEDGEGDGVFRVRRNAPADPAWIAYIVAVR